MCLAAQVITLIARCPMLHVVSPANARVLPLKVTTTRGIGKRKQARLLEMHVQFACVFDDRTASLGRFARDRHF